MAEQKYFLYQVRAAGSHKDAHAGGWPAKDAGEALSQALLMTEMSCPALYARGGFRVTVCVPAEAQCGPSLVYRQPKRAGVETVRRLRAAEEVK